MERTTDGNANVQALEAVFELSRLLNTGLDRETLAILMQLIDRGVNPEALAAVVRDLRKDKDKEKDTSSTAPIAVSNAPAAAEAGADATHAAAAFSAHRAQYQPPQQEPVKRRADY